MTPPATRVQQTPRFSHTANVSKMTNLPDVFQGRLITQRPAAWTVGFDERHGLPLGALDPIELFSPAVATDFTDQNGARRSRRPSVSQRMMGRGCGGRPFAFGPCVTNLGAHTADALGNRRAAGVQGGERSCLCRGHAGRTATCDRDAVRLPYLSGFLFVDSTWSGVTTSSTGRPVSLTTVTDASGPSTAATRTVTTGPRRPRQAMQTR